jgi:hypothetical protein
LFATVASAVLAPIQLHANKRELPFNKGDFRVKVTLVFGVLGRGAPICLNFAKIALTFGKLLDKIFPTVFGVCIWFGWITTVVEAVMHMGEVLE